ncbi:MAG TPA: nucleotide exchange factor GrpE [Chloroflexota bacterium]|nr:nucleotide exchange factor GrpE [Chloroflexota bacterium]
MEDTAVTTPEKEAPQDQAADPAARIQELEAAFESAKTEAAANCDKYLRERAEMDNYKKRIERTYADLAKRGRKDLLLKLLGPIDNLDRALAFESDPQNLLKGLRMIHSQFKELLAGEGLSEVKTVGEKFDPSVHEAIATEPADGREEGEILEEVQKGYTIGDELLRPARVKVASRP